MRRVAAFAGAMGIVTLGGCILLHDYDAYEFAEGPCTPGDSRPCYLGPAGTKNVGACKEGTQVCDPTTRQFGSCDGQTIPGIEVCSFTGAEASDEDCNGSPCTNDVTSSVRLGSELPQMRSYSLRSVAIDPTDGSIVFAGDFGGKLSFPGGTLNEPAQVDAYVAKLSDDLAGGWVKNYGIGNARTALGVALASNGDVLVAGELDAGAPNGKNAFVSRWRSDGTQLVWTREIGGAGEQQAVGLAVDTADNVYVILSVNGPITLPCTNTMHDAIDQDLVWIKYDLDGTCLAEKVFSSGKLYPTALAGDGSGNLVITGRYLGKTVFDAGDVLDDNQEKEDAVVMKLDANGALMWAKAFIDATDAGVVEGNAVAFAASVSGDVFVTGRTNGQVTFNSVDILVTTPEVDDVFVTALDGATGNARWARRFGGQRVQQGLGIAADANGGCFVTGTLEDVMNLSPGDDAASQVMGQIFLMNLDEGGNARWGQAFGATSDFSLERIVRVAASSKHGLVLGGGLGGQLDFGVGDAGMPIIEGVFLAKFNPPL